MTPALCEALRNIARVQLKFADLIASTQGADFAQEMTQAWQLLISALDNEKPKRESVVFGERLFAPRKRTKKT